MNRAVKLVAIRELREGLRNRAYMITFGISVVLVLAGVVLPVLFQSDDPVRLAVVGTSPVPEDELSALAATLDVDLEVSEITDLEAAERAIRDGDVELALVGGNEVVVEETLDPTLRAILAEAVGQRAMVDRLAELGVDADDAAEVVAAGEALQVRSLEERPEDSAFELAFAGTLLMLMAVTLFASAVLMAVVEEKSSRVVEVVLGAMRPWELLAGKLIGMGSLAFAQVTVLVVVAVSGLRLTGAVELPEATGIIAVTVVGWFVLGFAFYSTAYAAAGSLASRVEDAQSSAGPMAFVLFAAYFATFGFVMPDPDGFAATILSFLPPFAPMVVPARVALGAITPIEMLGSVLVTLVAIVGAVLLAGRIYERSVLRTERVSWRDAVRREPVG